MDVPAGAIPIDQFQAADTADTNTPPSGAIPVNQFQSAEEAYGTPKQQAIAGLEGAGRGLVGPLAPMLEKAAGVKSEAIRGRQDVNPWTSGAGETVGLLAPLLISGGASAGARGAIAAGELGQEASAGTSLLGNIAKYGTVAGVLDMAGDTALHSLGLASPAGYVAKVGSSIVRQAAEAATMQSSDEISRMVTQDINAPISAETALANVGLAGAFGGAAGGLFTGTVSPLWKATIGPKVEEFLKASRYHFNDESGKIIKDFSGVTPAVDTLAVKANPDQTIRSIADDYAITHGLKLNHDLPSIKADPERGSKIAEAYENMVHAPDDPKVRKSYNALMQETMDQWEAIKKTGLKVEAITNDMENPYKKSVDMINDVRNNNHLWYYPTSNGFGASDKLPKAFSAISSQVGSEFNPTAHEALKADLLKQGFKFSEGTGKYGGMAEPSIMVEHDGSTKAKQAIANLGKQYGQESVIHSVGNPGTRLNELQFMDGRPSVQGFGVEQNPNATKDFTENPLYGKFNLKFDKEKANTAHPLLAYTNEMIDGKPAQVNDIFRIVHDYFGHAKEGFSFGPNGADNAWHHHMQMYSKDAQRALTSETRGQNSWVNFGPKGQENRMNPATTTYAEQKAGLLPSWISNVTQKPITTVKIPLRGIKEVAETAKDFAMESTLDESYQSLSSDEGALNKAVRFLGIDISPVMKAAMSGEPKAVQLFNELRESQHPEVIAALKDLPNRIDAAVAKNLGTSLEDAAHYSDRDAGHELHDIFTKEYNEKYQPVSAAMDKRNAAASGLRIPDESRRDFGGMIIEKGMQDVGTDSPYYKAYEDYAQRVMAKDDMAGLDKLKTELFNRSKSLSVDLNEKNAYRDIRNMISEFQENQIAKEGVIVGKEGVMDSADVIAQRQAANKQYAAFSKMSDELSDHVGLGNFKGAGTLKDKMADISPEDLLKKFSPRGNTDSIPFLRKYFPETLDKVQETEAKKFLSPSVYQDKGETALDMHKLNRALEKTLKGSPEYARFVLPQGAQDKIKAAQTILDAIPGIKSSGTAGWMTKMMKHVPASAMSAIGFLSGHNPVSSYLLGEVAQRLGRDVPDAMKLSYLKFLGSDKPVKAEGFHAMVEMIHNTIKGHNDLLKATSSLFKTGVRVAAFNQMSANSDREKLDKIVSNLQKHPEQIERIANSELGHYLPAHQQAISQTTVSQIQYLNSLKPRAQKNSPLDEPTKPNAEAMARYNRALDIANNPISLLQDVKNGTIQATDMIDLKTLYPQLYSEISQRIINDMTNHSADAGSIPYKTRLGISLFLGTPLDSTMTPLSIMAAQSAFIKPTGQQGQQQNKAKRGTSTLGKSNNNYKTTSQAAESDRASRD